MTKMSLFAISHVFALCFCLISIAAVAEQDSKLPEIQISSALPKDSEPTEVHVIGETVIVLKTNQDYKWNITKNEITYSFAVWGNLIADWYAFEPSSDNAGHETVFWSIRQEGIFHSFDNSKWELKAEWFRE